MFWNCELEWSFISRKRCYASGNSSLQLVQSCISYYMFFKLKRILSKQFVCQLYFFSFFFSEKELVIDLNIPLGDPLQPTWVRDPETRKIILMGKIRNDIEHA